LSATLPSHSRITSWLDAARYSSESRPIELQLFLKCGSVIYNSRFEAVESAGSATSDLDHVPTFFISFHVCLFSLTYHEFRVADQNHHQLCIGRSSKRARVLPHKGLGAQPCAASVSVNVE
jgi:hypothetical protein